MSSHAMPPLASIIRCKQTIPHIKTPRACMYVSSLHFMSHHPSLHPSILSVLHPDNNEMGHIRPSAFSFISCIQHVTWHITTQNIPFAHASPHALPSCSPSHTEPISLLRATLRYICLGIMTSPFIYASMEGEPSLCYRCFFMIARGVIII